MQREISWLELVSKSNEFIMRVLGLEEKKDSTLYCNLTLLEEVDWIKMT